LESQQRPRKRRRKSHSRNIHRIILGLSLISVISICAVRLFYKNRSVPPPSSDSDCMVMAADGNGSESDTPMKNSMDTDLLQTLQALKKQEPKIQDIIEHLQEYPSELLEMLSKNLDMLDFVLEYPNKKGEVFSNTIGDIEPGTYPLLLQYDPRWGYAFYGDDVIAVNGCGPTCLSMVIAGLTGKNTITPYTVASYAEQQGYYASDSGTSWSLMSDGAAHFGILGKELALSQSAMENALLSGQPIICSMRPGDFTTTGHFIVITGLKDGKFIIKDPNSKERSNQLWEYQTLEHQISNLWAFQAL